MKKRKKREKTCIFSLFVAISRTFQNYLSQIRRFGAPTSPGVTGVVETWPVTVVLAVTISERW